MAVEDEIKVRFSNEFPGLELWMKKVKGQLAEKNIVLEGKEKFTGLKDKQSSTIQMEFKQKVKSF